MTVLSDGQIRRELEKGRLSIDPLLDAPLQIQPSTVDLRLAYSAKKYKDDVEILDPVNDDQSELMEESKNVSEIIVGPDEFVLGSTIECITLPDDIQGQVTGRSSYGRFGLTVHSTAGLIDPGWHGDITLEISNDTSKPIRIEPGRRICQLDLLWLDESAEEPYNARNDSKYQGQTGPTTSEARMDPDN